MANDSDSKKIKTKCYSFVVKSVNGDEVTVLVRGKDDKKRPASFNRFLFRAVGADVTGARGKITVEEEKNGFGTPIDVRVETGGRQDSSLREIIDELKEPGLCDGNPSAAQIIQKRMERAAEVGKDPYVMTVIERKEHEASVAGLVPGYRYRFSSPIEAGAISEDGSRLVGARRFLGGYYLGRYPSDGPCFFEGIPVGEKHPNIFKILFTGGALCERHPNQ